MIDPSTQPDSLDNSTDVQSLPPKLYMWRLSENLGERTILPADTATLNFQNTNLPDGMNGHYNMLGNLGSSRLSRIYFERTDDAHSLFLQPFTQFVFRPWQFNFTNSNIPYTGVSYYKAGDKLSGEERFKTYFSVNVNKRLAFGFNIDYLYGRGRYANQATSHFNAGVFASYIGERYQLQALYDNFNLRMNENGGITDDRYITNPEEMSGGRQSYEPQNIPVNMEQTANRNKDFFVYLSHRYRLGFHREVRPDSLTAMNLDSADVVEEFVPVTSFIHTFHIERSRHHFGSSREAYGMYDNTYLTDTVPTGGYGISRDSTT
ncbi:MAG: putative porin, partial [Prevotellaceae bacterium]|nr:putative porin [Prevotellaceae bacterium]